MANDLSEEFKKIWLAGIGAMAITAEKAEEMVEKLIKKGEITIEQGKALNEELKHKAREKVKDKVAGSKLAVEAIIDNLEDLSAEDIAALKARLAEVEARNGAK